MPAVVKIDGEDYTLNGDGAWSGPDPLMVEMVESAQRVATEVEFGDRYIPDQDAAVAEFVAEKLGGEVVSSSPAGGAHQKTDRDGLPIVY